MTILDALIKWTGGSVGSLKDLLESVAAASPDAKPTVDAWLSKLESELTVEKLAAVALALPQEMQNILKGKLDPRDHPSDAV